MNYGEITEAVTNEGSDKKYLKHGINGGVIVSSVDVLKLDSPKYQGDIIDVLISNDNNEENRLRLFPFTFNETMTHKRGDKIGSPITITEQQNDYLARIKHIFTKALGDDLFSKAMKGVNSFESMGKNLSIAVGQKKNKFAIMLIDKGGYANVPNWTGGFCALTAEELSSKWNEDKYGKKQLKANVGIEVPSKANDVFDIFS